MQLSQERGRPTFRDFLERYGVTLGILAALALVIVVLPSNTARRSVADLSSGSGPLAGAQGDGSVGSGDAPIPGGSGTANGGATGGAGPSAGTGPGAGGVAADGAGAVGDVLVGQGPCRSDKRQIGIAKYMPPCLSWIGKTNYGATARGVTAKQIKIVRWLGQVDPATQAILEANDLADSPAQRTLAFKALLKYSNQHFQTYGREVVMVDYNASGPPENDEAMKADGVRIANEVKPFAVIVGTPDSTVPKVLAVELAQRGVVCICTVSLSSRFYLENPPYLFSSLPTGTEYGIHTAEYIGKKLAGRKAIYAGDEFYPVQQYRSKTRKFGLLYIEGLKGKVDPEGKRSRDDLVKELRRYGVSLAAEAGYLYDPGRNQQDMSNIIANFKSKGVTTIIVYVDPLSPILITAEATRQQWYPEWFIPGTGLSDTTTAARLYDQTQWRHAFGITPLWVTWNDYRKSTGFREAHHGNPNLRDGDEGVLINIYRAGFQTLFRGIHLAGPKLTADTFAAAQFAFPKTGGSAALPLYFLTRRYPTEIKDFAEVYYDPNASGKDERGHDGLGMMMKANNGKRYQAGEWPGGSPSRNAGVAVSDTPQGGGDPQHEQDGHKHTTRCLSCT